MAKAAKPAPQIIECPPILVDTREPEGGGWSRHFEGPWTVGTIETGDYSLPGCQQWVSVERKTLDDLVGCLTKGRDRFERELKRARVIPHFCVVVESSYTTLLRGDYRSQLNPKSAWESVIAFELRYGIPFHFAGDVRTAAWWAESFLLRWWKEHFTALDEARKAIKRLGKD